MNFLILIIENRCINALKIISGQPCRLSKTLISVHFYQCPTNSPDFIALIELGPCLCQLLHINPLPVAGIIPL
jgi:hypothetical protein